MNYDAAMFDTPPTNPAIFWPLGVVYTGVITPTFPTSLGLPIPWINCGIGSEFPRFPTAVDISVTHPDERVVLIDGEPEPWNRGRWSMIRDNLSPTLSTIVFVGASGDEARKIVDDMLREFVEFLGRAAA